MKETTIKQQVFSEILEWGSASPMFVDEREVKEVFTKKLDLPDQYDMVLLEQLFNNFQRYGEKLSFIKNALEEKVGEAKFAKDTFKTRYDIAKRQVISGNVNVKEFVEQENELENSDELYRVWKFFYGVSRDKWDLLNKSFNHVRSCITTLRAELAKGVSHG